MPYAAGRKDVRCQVAIEKMTIVDIDGDVSDLDDVLVHCEQSSVFQPVHASKLGEYATGASLLSINPYSQLLSKFQEIGKQLSISFSYSEYHLKSANIHDPDGFIIRTDEYLEKLRREYPELFNRKDKLTADIDVYDRALEMIRHVDLPSVDFDELFRSKFLKFRFGTLPVDNVSHVGAFNDRSFRFYPFDSDKDRAWCAYITAQEYEAEVDDIFRSLGFERLFIPDVVHGSQEGARQMIADGLAQKKEKALRLNEEIQGFIDSEKEQFLCRYCEVRFLHDAYGLRKYSVVIKSHFHVVGFVASKDRDLFLDSFADMPQVTVSHKPAEKDTRLSTPVRLRNNWFVRPFEMFVSMYGYPSYQDVDPTPFVAYTYSLLFGMMFGDLGHGLAVALLGAFLWSKKKVVLGAIMARIGAVSAFFGLLYGSVFGNEHLLDPLFHALGFEEKPIEVLSPSTTSSLLIAAISIGVAIIVAAILYNIATGIKRRDFSRAILSQNGVAGLIFYTSLLMGVIRMLSSQNAFSTPYVIFLIGLPLLLIFLKKPVTRLFRYIFRHKIIESDKELQQTSLSEAKDEDIREVFTSEFLTIRFGRLPTGSYDKLIYYSNEPFFIFPIRTDREYIWCIYAASKTDISEIDAIFQDLYFERIYIPDSELKDSRSVRDYIYQCIETYQPPTMDEKSEHKTKLTGGRPKSFGQILFPEGIGAFLAENFFEMFEILLSFVTNTMSFLRVGGFILTHAGMMSVVYSLSQMVGSGASPLIIVLGNIFVMAMEGLIVGIQVLRLEFYEIFSRFFSGEGEPFQPVHVDYNTEPQEV